MRDDGSVDPAHAGVLSDELAVALYEHMVLARALDERLVALQRDGAIASHSSAIGEEAAIVGAAAAMHDEDWIFPAPRVRARPSGAACRSPPTRTTCSAPRTTRARAGRCPTTLFWKAAHVRSVSRSSGRRSPGRRRRLGGSHAEGRRRGPRLLRRRRDQLRRVPHRAQLRRRHARARRRLVPQQRLGHEPPASRQTASAGSPSRRVAYGAAAACASTATMSSPCSSVTRDARARASARRGAHADRGADLRIRH